MSKILYCSGSNRYSPTVAEVSLFGKTKSIEEWYQYSKRLERYSRPFDLRDGYGMKPKFFEVNGIHFAIEYMSHWYLYLWYMFFLQNPDALRGLGKYNTFIGEEGGNTINKPHKVLKYFNRGRKRAMKRVYRIIKSFEVMLFTLDPEPPEQPILIGDDDISFVPGTIGYPGYKEEIICVTTL